MSTPGKLSASSCSGGGPGCHEGSISLPRQIRSFQSYNPCASVAFTLAIRRTVQLPFTVDQFYGVFRAYNTTLWPAQIFLFALALIAIVLVMLPSRWSGAGVSAILAILWAWLGLAYHLAFFTAINPLAYGFAGISLAGSLIFFWQGVCRRRLEFELRLNARTAVGVSLVVFSLAIYPAWAIFAGHTYPSLPTFGLPCPTTIFTIGLLALTVAPCPRSAFVVPVLWSLVGGQAAFILGVPQDLGLLVAGIAGIVLAFRSTPASQEGA
jgi:hypothetical protein